MYNRERIDDPVREFNGSVQIYNWNRYGDVTYAWSTNQATSFVKTSEMHGQNIDHYSAKKRRGDLLPYTHYLRVISEKRYGHLSYSWQHNTLGSGSQVQQQSRGHSAIGVADVENAIKGIDPNRFLQEAAAHIGSSWDTLTFLAEVGHLIASYKRYAARMLSLTHPATLGDLWLDARYHWRPLIHDFLNLRMAAVQLIKKRERFTESAGTTYSFETVNSNTSVFDQAVITEVTTDVFKVGIRGSVTANYSRPPFDISPVTTMWELVPYSFLLDQIIDIGGLLRTLLFLNTTTGYTCGVGFKVEATRSISVSDVQPVNTGFTVGFSESSESKLLYILRAPSVIKPSTQTGLLGNVYHLIDVLALALRIIFAVKRKEPDARTLAYQ